MFRWMPLRLPSRALAFCLVCLLLASAQASTSVGPGGSIQAAIEGSCPGEVIEVQAGLYREHVVVDRPLTLRGAGWPVVDAMGSGSAITLSADGITLEGFCTTNTSGELPEEAGIKVTSSNNIVKGNKAFKNWDNLLLFRCRNNTIVGNVLTGGEEGIELIGSMDNIITDNRVNGNEDGIYLDCSHGNRVAANDVSNNSDDGILCINGSMYNTITGNKVVGNGWHGLELFYSSYNSIEENNASCSGVCNLLVRGSSHSLIANNTLCHGDNDGIVLVFSGDNRLSGNTACNNRRAGVLLEDSSNNTLLLNNASYNGEFGAYLDPASSSNRLYRNGLIGNGRFNAYDNGRSQWDDGRVGNLYGDYDEPREGCKDLDGNGICDRGYRISGDSSYDRYPLYPGKSRA